jgi:hypothetical protein
MRFFINMKKQTSAEHWFKPPTTTTNQKINRKCSIHEVPKK